MRLAPALALVLLAASPPEAGWTCGRKAGQGADTTQTAQVRPAPLPDSLPASPEAVVPPRNPPVAVARPEVPAGRLLVPVVGVEGRDLVDTFTQSRSEGRSHNAIDIMAPKGTPVVAAAAGRVRRLHTSERGGLTVYVLLPDGHTVHYYAHLDAYAPGLKAGQAVRAGDFLGTVGETGNVAPGSPHLHFAIWTAPDSLGFWDGAPINPYPLLKSAPHRPIL
jgi:peptidoglycan LD-endopeptidase LytH